MKTKTFNGAVLSKLGHPLNLEKSIKIPDPQEGQVLVKLFCSGVCHSQLMEQKGHRGDDKFLPHLLGHEGSGVVISIGNGVTKVKPNDNIVLTWIVGDGLEGGPMQYESNSSLINAGSVTTFNEYAIISENRCVKIPNNFPKDIAALLGCAVMTGCGMVKNTLNPEEGKSIAIFGLGGIGLSALMLCYKYNFKQIFCIDINQEKLLLAKKVNSNIKLINSKDTNCVHEIMSLTNGIGTDYAIDASGKASVTETAFEIINKKTGHLVFASHPEKGSKISIDPHDLICGKKITGSWGGESNPDKDVLFYCDLYLKGQLKLDYLISKKYSLSQVNDALNDLEYGRCLRPIINMEHLK